MSGPSVSLPLVENGANAKLKRWPAPSRYGTAGVRDAIGTVAAPLLAGFAITAATLVVASEDRLRWPGVAATLAATSAVVLIFSLQMTFWARQYDVTPSVMREWWDDADTVEGRGARVAEMLDFQSREERYARWARRSYDLGIAALFAALAVVLAPKDQAAQPGWRWVATFVAASAAVAEVAWSAWNLALELRDERDGNEQ